MNVRAKVEEAKRKGQARKFPGGSIVNRKAITETSIMVSLGAYLPGNAPQSAADYVEELKGIVRRAGADLDGIYNSKRLTLEGKRSDAKARALKAFREIDNSPSAVFAHEEIMERFRSVNAVLATERKVPSTAHEVMLAGDVRQYLMSLKKAEKGKFIFSQRGNADVVRAVLTAPSFLFGMTEDEVKAFEDAAQKALHPEEYTEREILEKAAAELERSTRKAVDMIAKAAELRLARDGETWLSVDEDDKTPIKATAPAA